MDSNLIELKCKFCFYIMCVDVRTPEEQESGENKRLVTCSRCFVDITEKKRELSNPFQEY